MNEAPIPTSFGEPRCSLCHGEGYVVEPGGAHAVARLCDCVPACALCGGSGLRAVEQGGQRRTGRCRCQRLPDRIILFNRAAIPSRHANSRFESFDIKWNPRAVRALHFSRAWAEAFRPTEENRGLVLCGDVGRGKTHLMVAVLRQLVMRHGVEVRFVEFSHLLSELKAGFDEGIGESTTLGPLVSVPVLAIDELGRGRGTDWERTIIDAIVSKRYNALRTLLATTNFSPKGAIGQIETNLALPSPVATLGDRLGDRVFSRLKEMCTFMPVEGEDCRILIESRAPAAARRTRTPSNP
jgi:DNA replication protein DnaC